MGGLSISGLSKGGGGGSKEFAKPKHAIQEGRIVRVIDRGIQAPKNPKYKPKRSLMITVELAEDTVEVENPETKKKEIKPMTANMFVNVSGKRQGGQHSKFTQLVASLLEIGDNEEFGLEDFLNKAVSVNLGKDDNGEINGFIDSLSPLSSRVAATVPDAVADMFAFDLTDPDPTVISKLGEGTLNAIKRALNYPGSKAQELIEGNSDSNVQDTGM